MLERSLDLSSQELIQANSDARAREAQLRQTNKMEAVGLLAGGIAHDFNNLLTAIGGFTSLLLEEPDLSPAARRFATQIHKAGDSAAALTHQLLAFSRRQILQPRPIDLNRVIQGIDPLFRRVIGEHIRLTTHLAPDLHSVVVDPGQAEQVVMNLAVNARDAMPEGGDLTIESANVTLDEAFVRAHPEAEVGSYVRLSISDTGQGMDADTLSRVFEPFFTTKQLGKGTGIGLATVYGIVKQSGGWIWVSSEVGAGTTFSVYFKASAAVAATATRAATAIRRGTETILFVEDQPGVREVGEMMLARCGYTVLSAAGGPEAIQAASGHRGPIHLLLTDVVMPGMNGFELAEAFIDLHPEAKILYMYMSGHVFDVPAVRDAAEEQPATFLVKPLWAEQLLERVQSILPNAGASGDPS
jgi:nitrogen-specific signal transduction histidine kinase/CheY-like chemotaxis protein